MSAYIGRGISGNVQLRIPRQTTPSAMPLRTLIATGTLREPTSLLLLIVIRIQDCLCRSRIRDMHSLVLLWLSYDHLGKI